MPVLRRTLREIRLALASPDGGTLRCEPTVTRAVNGFPRGSWEKEAGRRNEALDCRVYARAAAAIYGLDRFEERHWRQMERELAPPGGDGPPREPDQAPRVRRTTHSPYMARGWLGEQREGWLSRDPLRSWWDR